MRRTFFTGGKKKTKKQKSSGPIESWSTDPKDLPPGFDVGSMTAPYTPPGSPAEKYESRLSKKDKSKKSHQIEHSPLVTKFKQRKHLALSREISSPVGATLQGHQQRRNNFRRDRSCSVDALDELDGGQLAEKAEASISEIKGLKRSSSTGGDKGFDIPTLGGNSRRLAVNDRNSRPSSVVRSRSHHDELNKQKGDSWFSHKMLHEQKSVEQFLEAIESGTMDVNKIDPVTGDAPIHSIVKMKKKYRTDFLLALLVNTEAKVDLENRKRKLLF